MSGIPEHLAKFYEWWNSTKWTSPRLKEVARAAWLQAWITKETSPNQAKEQKQ